MRAVCNAGVPTYVNYVARQPLSFLLSLIASVLYLVIQSFTRFSVTPSPAMVNTGYTITIIAITLTMLLVTFWLYSEWSVRHPHSDDFMYEYERPKSNKSVTEVPVALLQTGSVDNSVAEKVDDAWAELGYGSYQEGEDE